ncbi:MAG: hypothetical protein EBV06_04150 [Planctomycetia bacterium]|nr:hypothetical protein [Planctomycetia bacterium]
MRTFLLLLLVLILPLRAEDDEKAKKIAARKAAIEMAWMGLDVGPLAMLETETLRLVAPKEMESKLKAIAVTVEKYRVKALSTLKIDEKESLPDKITVYLLPSSMNYPSFARMIEKRRPETGETGSFSAEDDKFHAAAAPSKMGPPVEVTAGEMVASLLLMRKAGVRSPVPEWLVRGFGRATTYRLSPKDKLALADKKLIRTVVKKKNAADIWDGKLDLEESLPMNAALAEFFAYGPGAARFIRLVMAYKPTEENNAPTTAQAFDAIGVSGATIEKTFKTWVVK